MSAHTIASPIGSTSVVEPETTDSAASSDAELLSRARRGDDSAFATLWRRHLPAAYAVATRFRGRVAAEDLVAEASARILRLLREGGGPTDNFRSYFASTVRTVGVDAVRREMNVVPTEAPDLEMLVDPEPDVSALAGGGVDTDIVRAAFRLLGDSDQQLLWHTMVEGSAPRVVAPLLGVSANAVSARAMRARDALRNSYLDVWVQRRVPACGAPECRWTLDHLGGFVRGRLTSRQRARAAAHLEAVPARCLPRRRAAARLRPVRRPDRATRPHRRGGRGRQPRARDDGGAREQCSGGDDRRRNRRGGRHSGRHGHRRRHRHERTTAGVGADRGHGRARRCARHPPRSAGAASSGSSHQARCGHHRDRGDHLDHRGDRHRDRRHRRHRRGTAAVALPVAAGVAGSAVLTSGAVAGGSILAGSTLGPPLATAFAGLVVGMGVAVAPAAAQQLPPPAPAAVVVTAGPAVAPAPAAPRRPRPHRHRPRPQRHRPPPATGTRGARTAAPSPTDLLQLIDLTPALPGAGSAVASPEVLPAPDGHHGFDGHRLRPRLPPSTTTAPTAPATTDATTTNPTTDRPPTDDQARRRLAPRPGSAAGSATAAENAAPATTPHDDALARARPARPPRSSLRPRPLRRSRSSGSGLADPGRPTRRR